MHVSFSSSRTHVRHDVGEPQLQECEAQSSSTGHPGWKIVAYAQQAYIAQKLHLRGSLIAALFTF
jgi:hypothetical protein